MNEDKETLPFVKDLSPITCIVKDDTGAGLMGFTAVYTDGSFKNISLAFNPDTEAAVQAEITNIKQIMERSLVAIPAAKHPDNENKRSSQKRRQS